MLQGKDDIIVAVPPDDSDAGPGGSGVGRERGIHVHVQIGGHEAAVGGGRGAVQQKPLPRRLGQNGPVVAGLPGLAPDDLLHEGIGQKQIGGPANRPVHRDENGLVEDITRTGRGVCVRHHPRHVIIAYIGHHVEKLVGGPAEVVQKLVLAFPVLVDDTKIILQLAWLRKPIIVWTASGRIKLASSTKSRLKSWPRIPFVLWLEANTMVLRDPSGNEKEMVSL